MRSVRVLFAVYGTIFLAWNPQQLRVALCVGSKQTIRPVVVRGDNKSGSQPASRRTDRPPARPLTRPPLRLSFGIVLHYLDLGGNWQSHNFLENDDDDDHEIDDRRRARKVAVVVVVDEKLHWVTS